MACFFFFFFFFFFATKYGSLGNILPRALSPIQLNNLQSPAPLTQYLHNGFVGGRACHSLTSVNLIVSSRTHTHCVSSFGLTLTRPPRPRTEAPRTLFKMALESGVMALTGQCLTIGACVVVGSHEAWTRGPAAASVCTLPNTILCSCAVTHTQLVCVCQKRPVQSSAHPLTPGSCPPAHGNMICSVPPCCMPACWHAVIS